MNKRATVAVVAALALALLAGPVGAHEIVLLPTEVLELNATGGDTIAVDGDVVFGGEEPKVLAEDDAGDNLGGPLTAPLGVDLLEARISWPEPELDDLMFELVVSELPPLTDGTYETVAYDWDFHVDGGTDAGGATWSLQVLRSSFFYAQTSDPYATLNECTAPDDAGAYSCETRHRFEDLEFEQSEDGEYRIRVFVPIGILGVQPGATISASSVIGDSIRVGTSASGRFTFTGLYDSIASHADYTVPAGKTVLLGAASSGEDLTHDTPATLAGDDTFTGTLTVPGPGTYDVGALACFADNCGTAIATVTTSEE